MLFLDSGLLDEAALAASLPFVGGLTCNPTLLARALGCSTVTQEQLATHLRALAALMPGPLFVQTLAATVEGIIEDAHFIRLVLGSERVVVKVPYTPEGLQATRRLAGVGVATCTTAIYSVLQAQVAALAGARWVAPYCNRITQAGGDGVATVAQMRSVLAAHRLDCRVLVASVKSLAEVEAVVGTGVEAVTAPLSLLQEMASHRLSREATARFAADLSWA